MNRQERVTSVHKSVVFGYHVNLWFESKKKMELAKFWKQKIGKELTFRHDGLYIDCQSKISLMFICLGLFLSFFIKRLLDSFFVLFFSCYILYIIEKIRKFDYLFSNNPLSRCQAYSLIRIVLISYFELFPSCLFNSGLCLKMSKSSLIRSLNSDSAVSRTSTPS